MGKENKSCSYSLEIFILYPENSGYHNADYRLIDEFATAEIAAQAGALLPPSVPYRIVKKTVTEEILLIVNPKWDS